MNISPEMAKAGLKAMTTATHFICETVREKGTISSGELYALMMPTGISLQSYEQLEAVAVKSGVISKSGNLLTWEGAK